MKEKFVRINKIEGYEDVREWYYLSNSDEDVVINKNTRKMKKIRLNKDGYKIVDLMTKDGSKKTCYLHVLKAKAFIYTPNPLNYNIIRHLNDIKTDNRLENLAWGTQSDNIYDCIRNGNFNYEASAKKTSKPVRCIETGIIYASTREAERQTGILNAGISHCCNGTRNTAGGFHFEFVNKEENENE